MVHTWFYSQTLCLSHHLSHLKDKLLRHLTRHEQRLEEPDTLASGAQHPPEPAERGAQRMRFHQARRLGG